MKKFLFLCGTPRSGTTFLAGVIGRHPLIALGVERFKHHYTHKTLTPELFEKARFFDLRAEDTAKPEQIALPQIGEMSQKYDGCEFVGDKYPNIVRHLEWIGQRFDKPVFLAVLRHPAHVARSWAARALNEKDRWPEKNDFSAGLAYWADTLKRLSTARDAGMNVIPIDYDLLTLESSEMALAHLTAIFEQLQLPGADVVHSALLETRLTGIDKKRSPLAEAEQQATRNLLHSHAWRGFQKRFVDGRFSKPAWADLS